MPPKSVAKRSSMPTRSCRRSKRIAYRIKSMAKGQPSSIKESRTPLNKNKSVAKRHPVLSEEQISSTTEKPSYNESSEAETQPESSKGGRPSSTKVGGKPTYKRTVQTKTQQVSIKKSGKSSTNKKSVTKRNKSSNKGQSTSTKKSPAKRRRLMKTDEINKESSEVRQQEPEDFSICIEEILEELSPDLTISEEAIADMSKYLNHVFDLLVMASAISYQLGSSTHITEKEIEHGVVRVVEGDLAKYCVAEGRRAVKKWNELNEG